MKIERAFVVDVEGNGFPAPCLGDARIFGACHVTTLNTFSGYEFTRDLFEEFERWILANTPENAEGEKKPVFVSDNNGYDWQWINHYFWKLLGRNPFGPFSRRIGDFWAGLELDWEEHSEWKKLRKTRHDHNPVHDAVGNAEALLAMLNIARDKKASKETSDEHHKNHY